MNPPIASYGADRVGFICGFVFAPDNAGRTIGLPEAHEWLARAPDPQGCDFAWLHFNLATGVTEKWMLEHLALPDAFHEALREGSQSTRIEYVDGSLIAVVNDALYDFSFGAADIATLWICVDRGRVVTARRKPLRSIDRLRAAVRSEAPSLWIVLRRRRD